VLRGQRLNRVLLRSVPASGGARRLRVDGKDPMPGIDQGTQDRRSESWGAHEHEAERSPRTGGAYR